MPKILILNQCTADSSYLGIDALSRSTWSTVSHPDVTVVHYYGALDSENRKIHNFPHVNPGEAVLQKLDDLAHSYLFCGVNDVFVGSHDPRSAKFMIALEYCFNNFEFDFLVRCSNTTYNDLEKMHRILSGMRRERLYEGARNMNSDGYYFVAGWHSYMTRDCVKLVVENKQRYLDLPYSEDLALGVLLMHELKHTDFKEDIIHTFSLSAHQYDDLENLYKSDDNIFAYRFRSYTLDRYIRFHNHVLKSKTKSS